MPSLDPALYPRTPSRRRLLERMFRLLLRQADALAREPPRTLPGHRPFPRPFPRRSRD